MLYNYLTIAVQFGPGFLATTIVYCFVYALPILLLLVTAYYYFHNKAQLAKLENNYEEVATALAPYQNRSMANLQAVSEVLNEKAWPELRAAQASLQDDSQVNYAYRWLPPLNNYLNPSRLSSPQLQTALSFSAATLVLSSGLLAALLVSLYLFSVAGSANIFYSPRLAIAPLGLGVIGALVLANNALRLRQRLNLLAAKLQETWAKVFPVYDNLTGISLLVDDMLAHDKAMQLGLERFERTTRRMAEADFAGGICQSVRKIMQEELTPPIRESARLLSDLARHLDQRQMHGMEQLSGKFSAAVAHSLGEHLNPIAQELQEFNTTMHETREFIEDSIAVLETSREQNITLNRDLSESLRLMTAAKNELVAEMAEISDSMAIVSKSSERMSVLYAGEEASLAEKVFKLSETMERSIEVLDKGLKGSSQSIELAANLRLDQEAQNAELQERLSYIISELKTIGETMRISSKNFTQESGAYVNQTLKNFDNGLAEVVERLIFTASAIRDAVDSLPVALRPNKD